MHRVFLQFLESHSASALEIILFSSATGKNDVDPDESLNEKLVFLPFFSQSI
jgi:hypothetical protein